MNKSDLSIVSLHHLPGMHVIVSLQPNRRLPYGVQGMWIEEIALENIKCFDRTAVTFKKGRERANWVTLLSENGGGKTTLLQSIALMLAGPEVSTQLLPRPLGWVRDEKRPGKISCRIHKDDCDSGAFGVDKVRNAFGYSMHVTGAEPVTIRGKAHSQPGLHESNDKVLSWLRQNAFSSNSHGWFAAGYGAFRRLTRRSQVIVPTMQSPSRFTNFSTQFFEDEGLAAFENWLIYLDYQDAKGGKVKSKRLKEMSVEAVNGLLPDGVTYDSIDSNGRILFDVKGEKVPTFALSDGYRSVLALAGDLVWRLIASFPDATEPLSSKGVVLIDELDIHLHPVWQRDISGWLRAKFPNLQFIVTTHSPMVAAGAGADALTLRVAKDELGVLPVGESLFAMDIEDILKSEAFGLVSTYSPETQSKIDALERLHTKGKRKTPKEEVEYQQLSLFFQENNPFGIVPLPTSLERRIDNYMKKMKE
jgi:hypothetical protein